MLIRTTVVALAIAFTSPALVAPALAADCQSEIQVIDQYMTERQADIAEATFAEAAGVRNQAAEACNAGDESTAQAFIEKVKQILTAS